MIRLECSVHDLVNRNMCVVGRFYDEFKMFLLLGCHEDDANRSKLAKLLRFVPRRSVEKLGKKDFQVSVDRANARRFLDRVLPFISSLPHPRLTATRHHEDGLAWEESRPSSCDSV